MMPDWLIVWLGQLQGEVVRTLAAALRTGGWQMAGLAFGLGALHALTPGHGKAALAAYFLGQEAHVGKGLRVALSAALLHVLTGFAIFLVLRVLLGQMPSMSDRGSPLFAAAGYGLIVVSGLLMIVQSLRPAPTRGDPARSLAAGIGLLPCPLTISVLGFAWIQSSWPSVAVVLVSLALGIAATISLVALLAIVVRNGMTVMIGEFLPGLDRWARVAQVGAGVVVVMLGLYMTVAAIA